MFTCKRNARSVEIMMASLVLFITYNIFYQMKKKKDERIYHKINFMIT